ncbi:MAG: ABC transporter permease subunit [Planctomycetaceae bacterium]|nr:ABC transporter permease subunit [Planctomycetaceae bacterium]
MNFANVRLILAREIRDQLRDRRTLFMIAVLPILLYPLLGMSLLQVSQFMQEQKTRVLVVGTPRLTGFPPLFEGNRFAEGGSSQLLELQFAPDEPSGSRDAADLRAEADRLVRAGQFDAALYFPPDFAARLGEFRAALHMTTPLKKSSSAHRGASSPPPGEPAKARPMEIPSPEIICNTANDKSQIAFVRLHGILGRWMERVGEDNLVKSGLPVVAARPFLVHCNDVSDVEHREASMWAKVLPILLLIWAMTGAFYPAVDLCAGEKERGTLETLLCSPAGRSEIAVGKLAAIMLFSVATVVLNLVSVGVTGWFVASKLPGFGMPPMAALAAVCIALPPIAALFSALCLALAAFARSTKEGQYYLMPLLLITMPLVVLPMSPGVELNLGNSLIPITGIVLLLRAVLEGHWWHAMQYTPAVTLVTLLACLLSIRWAVEQFNSESVLFRTSERWSPGLWLRRLFLDRPRTPTFGAAVGCGLLILLINFFLSLSHGMPGGFGDFARMVLIVQLGAILVPTLALTLLLTRSPGKSLGLTRPVRWSAVPAAMLLAAALHPTASLLQRLVQHLYPVSDSVLPAFQKLQKMFHDANLWPLLLLIAVVPAICEELAFRGFILRGFCRSGRVGRAIVLSAILFGVTHGILQQSLIASLLGVLLGWLAVQSGSILPGVAFHMVHNGLLTLNGRIVLGDVPLLRRLVTPIEGGGMTFQWPAVAIGALLAALVVMWFARFAEDCNRDPQKKVFVPGEPSICVGATSEAVACAAVVEH